MSLLQKLFLLCLISALGLLTLFPTVVSATEYKSNKDGIVRLKEREVIQDNFHASGERVLIEGYVLGDLFVAGNDIDISGTVNGDVYAAGNSVDISGDVAGTVFVAAQDIKITGTVGRSAILAGATGLISSTIKEDIVFAGANLTLDGEVGDDARIFGNMVEVNSSIGGDLIISAADSEVDKSKVIGEIYDKSDDKDSKEKKASGLLAGILAPGQEKGLTVGKVANYIFGLAGLFILLAFVYKLMPVKVLRAMHIANTGHMNLIKAFGEGFLLTFLIPMAVVFFGILGLVFPNVLLAVYGPLLWLLVVIYLFLMILGHVAITFAIGDKVQRKFFPTAKANWVSKAWSGVLFWAVLNLLLMIPIVNIFALVFEWVIMTIGIGLVVIDKSLMWNYAWGGRRLVSVVRAPIVEKPVVGKKVLKRKPKKTK